MSVLEDKIRHLNRWPQPAERNRPMSLFDDDTPKKPQGTKIIVGQDLSTLSESELAERIVELEQEIIRTKETLSKRSNIRNEAEALFEKPST